ncbi:MAG: hypothetical protein HYW02_07630 [Deltaproteobacteria bacterium]|nr:hypothetical protein [Deltaproteobacteria bacterium]MBI2501309.1 hypothetical protein [Deltaproteobacteria bacterium]MBI4196583.1 hypothetical protein [Deltaproteobacteria bacterium]
MGALEKILRTGLGAALITEEGIKGYISKQAQQRKQEIANRIAREFSNFLRRVDLHKEIRKALQGLTIEIRIKPDKR